MSISTTTKLSDDLTKKMRDCGWTIKVTKLEESEYDLEEDRYSEYEYYLEMKRVQEKEDEYTDYVKREQEKEDEAEEYYRRRRDPYWENDSDYD